MSNETKAPQPPAEAQPCGCGEATCTVPWEPGCGLGKSEQHAEVQAQGGGEAAIAHQPVAPVGVEGVEAALQKWLDWCNEHNEEPEARSGARIAIEALAQQPAAFRNNGNSEAEFIADDAIACTACGGSGHRDDQQPAAVDGTLRVVGQVVRHMSPGQPEGKSVIWNDLPEAGTTLYALAAQQGGSNNDR